MGEVSKAFFSEEKKQKTFDSAVARLLGGVAFLLFVSFGALAEPTAAQPRLPTQKLTIVSVSGARHEFEVEVATTPEQQEVGEMFRTNIPANTGMFFDWGTPRDIPMWMKNCPVPEDMVFIGADGRISHIAENTVPESLVNISSGGPARATLELQGGLTAKLNISVGDKVTGIIFK